MASHFFFFFFILYFAFFCTCCFIVLTLSSVVVAVQLKANVKVPQSKAQLPLRYGFQPVASTYSKVKREGARDLKTSQGRLSSFHTFFNTPKTYLSMFLNQKALSVQHTDELYYTAYVPRFCKFCLVDADELRRIKYQTVFTLDNLLKMLRAASTLLVLLTNHPPLPCRRGGGFYSHGRNTMTFNARRPETQRL